MQDMAEMIVEQARIMPTERGVALTCNGARIAKVEVTGGFGLEVTSADKERRLVFALNEKTSQGVQMVWHTQGSNPRLADPRQVCYSHVWASPWTGGRVVLDRGPPCH